MKKALIIFTAILTVAFMSVTPVLAFGCHYGSDDIDVDNENCARVSNTVVVIADTGDNNADGGHGNDGGSSGGTIAFGGSRATGGDGGDGGGNAIVITGDAIAGASVVNMTNTNSTRIIAPCDCDGDVDVDNDNCACIRNKVIVKADAGDNEADGGHGNDGGDSGKTLSACGSNTTGGDAGWGGGNAQIQTGDAYAGASLFNITNSNITRIRR